MSPFTRARASRSCGNCRAVRRRCDKQSPQCGQCIRTCQGYRDEWDLVFRDQTSHTIKRSKKKPRNNTISTELPLTHSLPPARGPDLSLDIGVKYFLQEFVAAGRVPTRVYLNYIPTVYSPNSEHPTLVASMAAVGLVALATRQPELVHHAYAKYSEAIRHVNNAIASPTESVKDSTLMSVILLGVFEHVSNFESWVRHVIDRPLPAVHLPTPVHSGSAMRTQILSSFIQIHFPPDEPMSRVNLQQFLHSGIYRLPRESEMMDKALIAMSCLFLGKTQRDSLVFCHGLRLYNDAIGIMSTLIHQNTYSDEILYAAFIFQEIAGSYCPSTLKSWASHVSGMNAVIGHFRERANSNPLIDTIYNHQQKLNMIFLYRGMDLSREEYKLIMEPTESDPLLELLQIAVAIEQLQAAIDSIESSDPMICQEFLDRCYGAKRRLMDLESNGSFGEAPSESTSARFLEPSKTKIPPTEPLFGLAYCFSSKDNAMLHMMFWVQLVVLQPIIYRARSVVNAHTDDKPPTHAIEDHEYLLSGTYANEIARATPYCLQESMKSSCIQIVIFVTSAISTTFLDFEHRDKFDWCQHVFCHMADRGFDTALHLTALARARWDHRASRRKKLTCLSLRRQIS